MSNENVSCIEVLTIEPRIDLVTGNVPILSSKFLHIFGGEVVSHKPDLGSKNADWVSPHCAVSYPHLGISIHTSRWRSRRRSPLGVGRNEAERSGPAVGGLKPSEIQVVLHGVKFFLLLYHRAAFPSSLA
ncbi:hypothetical protein CISG_07183 [Coccidioides immitis RMSCC 3703]|uniref:Uncharacterized protein n=1 Tax=Coccidioides immitis RMSCC 3703 TaxID=454286 RepID=A0A0J8R463_COCIT|nr:hypothetical protein CISG_07183 [Coccidioides immitis RMSCC 3703]